MPKKKELKKEAEASKKKETYEYEIDGACSHCGAKGYKVTLKFCSEACRDAFISNYK